MYLTDTQIIARASEADALAVYTYINGAGVDIDAGALADWAAQHLPDNDQPPGLRLTLAVASLQQQGKLYEIGGGWIPSP